MVYKQQLSAFYCQRNGVMTNICPSPTPQHEVCFVWCVKQWIWRKKIKTSFNKSVCWSLHCKQNSLASWFAQGVFLDLGQHYNGNHDPALFIITDTSKRKRFVHAYQPSVLSHLGKCAYCKCLSSVQHLQRWNKQHLARLLQQPWSVLMLKEIQTRYMVLENVYNVNEPIKQPMNATLYNRCTCIAKFILLSTYIIVRTKSPIGKLNLTGYNLKEYRGFN